jgi:hypothetical protein
MSYQRLDNFQTTLSTTEVQSLRSKIQESITELNLKKQLIHTNEYNNLYNHYRYILGIYDNMLMTKKLQQKGSCNYNPYNTKHTILYAGDGSTTTIIDERDIKDEEWLEQFELQVQNPDNNFLVPNQIWDIAKIKSINIG